MSINIKQLAPAIAIHPGEILKDELAERNIKQKDFALLTNIPQTQLNEIIKGKRGINADIALLFAKALKMDAVLWLNLQANYELDVAKVNDKNIVRLEAIDQWEMIKPYIPEKYLKQQGFIIGNPINDIPVIKNIYKVPNFDQLVGVYSQTAYLRFRKSEKLGIDKINVVGWVKLVNYKADNIKVKQFDIKKKSELIAELKAIFKLNKKTVDKTIETLAKYGIKLIIQPHPEKCAVDGISFWSKGNPAIGLSLRHKRIDNFAFTVMHELGHIFLHLINNNTAEFIDLDKDHNTPEYKNSKEEKEADEFSKSNLIDKNSWDAFLRSNPRFVESAIKAFAVKMQVHPGIVQGRYCHEKEAFGVKSSIDKTLA